MLMEESVDEAEHSLSICTSPIFVIRQREIKDANQDVFELYWHLVAWMMHYTKL